MLILVPIYIKQYYLLYFLSNIFPNEFSKYKKFDGKDFFIIV